VSNWKRGYFLFLSWPTVATKTMYLSKIFFLATKAKPVPNKKASNGRE